MRRAIAKILVAALTLTTIGAGVDADAAKKPKLAKKNVQVLVGKSKKVKIKNLKKKQVKKLKVKEVGKKKIVKVKKIGKTRIKVTGKKVGTAKVKVILTRKGQKKKIKLKLKVTVKANTEQEQATEAGESVIPAAGQTSGASSLASVSASALPTNVAADVFTSMPSAGTTVPTAEVKDPATQETMDPATQGTTDPAIQVTTEPATEGTEEPTSQGTIEPTSKASTDPVAGPTFEATSEPVESAATASTAIPTVKSEGTPTVKPEETPTVKPAATSTVAPTTAPTAAPTASSEAGIAVLNDASFENGTEGYTGRGGATVSVTANGYEGNGLYCTGRSQDWNGATLDVTDQIVPGATYEVTAYMKAVGTDGENVTLKVTAQKDGGSTGTTYTEITSKVTTYNTWTALKGTIQVDEDFTGYQIYFETPGQTCDFYIDEVVITQITAGSSSAVAVAQQVSLKDTYASLFENIGTCANYYGYGVKKNQLIDEDKIEFVTKHFNSITLENEMKPDSVLGSSATTITVSEAKEKGYVIPDNYTETKVPSLNLDTIDKTIEFCYNHGIRMRGHTFMWHQQTPTWFFVKNYSGSTVVSEDVMNARMEFYIRSVMKHIMEKEKALGAEPGDVVYAYDVVNEYLHHTNEPASITWVNVYGEQELNPSYVKKAFEIAYEELKEYNVENKITLFYNDYNTYMEVEDLCTFVRYINEGEEANICGGIGMQSHLDVTYPTVTYFGNALETFLNTGLEVQITELDVTTTGNDSTKTDQDQADYIQALMEKIIEVNESRDRTVNPKGVTGITLWGFYDSCSWRSDSKPLLFGSGITKPKLSYYSFLEAASSASN